MARIELDTLIIGGGIAGLWLLDELRRSGASVLLVESSALGNGQTSASQGILHGGFKHAIGGREQAYVHALTGMPELWRASLSGAREPDLSAVRLRGESLYCWRTRSLSGFVGHIGALFGLRISPVRVAHRERPIPLQGCPGSVFRLDEQIVDPKSLISVLAERNTEHLVRYGRISFSISSPGTVDHVHLASETHFAELRPKTIVLTAGEGNADLRGACGLPNGAIKRLPLSILVARGPLPLLNGFCVEGAHAKAVITSQPAGGEMIWQVGCEGVSSEDPDFEEKAIAELRDALPGFNWPDVRFTSYRTNRAEYVERDKNRSDGVQVFREGNVISAWPTKFVLAPLLAYRTITLMDRPSPTADVPSEFAEWPRPVVANDPWSAS